MFHGNADVERGFHVNAEIMSSNLKERTLKALRLTHDTIRLKMQGNQEQLEKIDIQPDLIKYVASSHQKYVQYLEDQKRLQSMRNMSERSKRNNDGKETFLILC